VDRRNYITEDTEILSAQANQKAIAGTVELVKESAKFEGIPLPEDLDRKMKLLKLALTLPAPANEKEAEEADAHQERHGSDLWEGQVLSASGSQR
jgi:peptidyl-dipeptidase A